MGTVGRFLHRRCGASVWLVSSASAVIGLIIVAAPASAADLDVPQQDYPAYSQRAYPPYPPAPAGAPAPYGYRHYGPAYPPQAYVDPEDDEPDARPPYRYRYSEEYRQGPPAPYQGPPGPYVERREYPRGAYGDPRNFPPEDMFADEAPPPYGWRGPRW